MLVVSPLMALGSTILRFLTSNNLLRFFSKIADFFAIRDFCHESRKRTPPQIKKKKNFKNKNKKWSCRESNPPPLDCVARAVPSTLPPTLLKRSRSARLFGCNPAVTLCQMVRKQNSNGTVERHSLSSQILFELPFECHFRLIWVIMQAICLRIVFK